MIIICDNSLSLDVAAVLDPPLNAVFISCAFCLNLSPRDKISNTIAWQPFSLLVFAKLIILLVISSGFFVDLKSLVPMSRLT